MLSTYSSVSRQTTPVCGRIGSPSVGCTTIDMPGTDAAATPIDPGASTGQRGRARCSI